MILTVSFLCFVIKTVHSDYYSCENTLYIYYFWCTSAIIIHFQYKLIFFFLFKTYDLLDVSCSFKNVQANYSQIIKTSLVCSSVFLIFNQLQKKNRHQTVSTLRSLLRSCAKYLRNQDLNMRVPAVKELRNNALPAVKELRNHALPFFKTDAIPALCVSLFFFVAYKILINS